MIFEKMYVQKSYDRPVPVEKQTPLVVSLVKFLTIASVFLSPLLYLFLYIDIAYGCTIVIYPSFIEFSNPTIKNAVKVIKNFSPEDYENLCKNVKIISPNVGCGGFEGGCYYPNEPQTIHISTSLRNLSGTPQVIIHELCHVMQAKEGRPMAEDECYTKDTAYWKDLIRY